MTREEVTKRLKGLKNRCERLIVSSNRNPDEWRKDAEAVEIAISSLRPVSREQVEKVWRGKWKCHGDCGLTECSICGLNIEEYVGNYNFCPVCGTPMTDEAVEMVMERMEALHETT